MAELNELVGRLVGSTVAGSGALAGTNLLQTTSVATAGGGWTAYPAVISAASTNATNVKASAGTIGAISCFNLNASPRYLKLYDKASAPTVGTDVPNRVLMIPGNTSGAGLVSNSSEGWTFLNGISFALTTGIANTDATAVAANEIVVNIGYI